MFRGSAVYRVSRPRARDEHPLNAQTLVGMSATTTRKRRSRRSRIPRKQGFFKIVKSSKNYTILLRHDLAHSLSPKVPAPRKHSN